MYFKYPTKIFNCTIKKANIYQLVSRTNRIKSSHVLKKQDLKFLNKTSIRFSKVKAASEAGPAATHSTRHDELYRMVPELPSSDLPAQRKVQNNPFFPKKNPFSLHFVYSLHLSVPRLYIPVSTCIYS